jgi:hypothetical protein
MAIEHHAFERDGAIAQQNAALLNKSVECLQQITTELAVSAKQF